MVKLLVCDLDESYLDALVKFILTSDESVDVTCYSDMVAFSRCRGSFDVVLMTHEFYDQKPKELIGQVYYQLAGTSDKRVDDVECIYKFQSMDSLLRKLGNYSLSNGRKMKDEGRTRIVGVFSPSHHMHTVSFAFVYAKLCREYGKVLLVNLAESTGNFGIGYEGNKNLIDYIYELSSNRNEIPLSDYVVNFEGIQCLLPAVDPEEIWEIGKSEWAKMVTEFRNSNYGVVVLLFGEFGRNFFDLIEYLDDLMLVGGDDKFSITTKDQFQSYLLKRGCDVAIQDVVLNKDLCDRIAMYDLDVIMNGNLTEWLNGVRRDSRVAAVG